MDDNRINYPNPEKPAKRNHLQQILTNNVPTNDVENPNHTD